MGEQRVGARLAVGQVERGGKLLAAGAFELETFGRHDVVPNRCVFTAARGDAWHRLTLSYNRYGLHADMMVHSRGLYGPSLRLFALCD